MGSSVALYILVATLMLVQCNAEYGKEPEDFNKYRVANCQDVRTKIGHTVKNSLCQPRETHVFPKPKPGYEFRPPMVTARRCSGHCPHDFVPMPTSTTQTEYAIQMHPKGNPTAGLKCVVVEVEEHMKCRCMCSKGKESCNHRQIYDARDCSCKCKDQERKKLECEAQFGMAWDDKECSCNCTKMNMACTTGLEWNRISCKCDYGWY